VNSGSTRRLRPRTGRSWTRGRGTQTGGSEPRPGKAGAARRRWRRSGRNGPRGLTPRRVVVSQSRGVERQDGAETGGWNSCPLKISVGQAPGKSSTTPRCAGASARLQLQALQRPAVIANNTTSLQTKKHVASRRHPS
jgi:hypothetical protein